MGQTIYQQAQNFATFRNYPPATNPNTCRRAHEANDLNIFRRLGLILKVLDWMIWEPQEVKISYINK